MAGDLITELDNLTTTLDGATGVTAYWVPDLNPNDLPTTAYVALQQVPQGVLTDFGGAGFGDFVVQVTSYSPNVVQGRYDESSGGIRGARERMVARWGAGACP